MDTVTEDSSSYTAEALAEMRRAGMAKPAAVSSEQWDSSLPPPVTEIETAYSKLVAHYSAERQEKVSAKEVFSLMAQDAFLALAQVLSDPNASLKLKMQAAIFTLEKDSGKAGQSIELTGQMQFNVHQQAKDIEAKFANVAELQRAIGTQATTSNIIDSAEQITDAFLKANEGFSVGKRAAIGEGEESE